MNSPHYEKAQDDLSLLLVRQLRYVGVYNHNVHAVRVHFVSIFTSYQINVTTPVFSCHLILVETGTNFVFIALSLKTLHRNRVKN